jgi:hypothetical protein
MDRDAMADRGRSLEEEYFKRKDRELLERTRAQQAQAEARQRLAAAFGVQDEATVTALMEAGLDEAAAGVLELIPAVQVAWCDGDVPAAERDQVVRLFERTRSTAADASSVSLLKSWLDVRPTDAFFAAALAALRARLQSLPAEERIETGRRITSDAASVAGASGGLLGFRAVSEAESRCIHELESALLSS